MLCYSTLNFKIDQSRKASVRKVKKRIYLRELQSWWELTHETNVCEYFSDFISSERDLNIQKTIFI